MKLLSKKIYKIIFFLVVLILMFMPVVPSELNNLFSFFGLNDKSEHFIVFFLLSLLLNRASNTAIHRVRNVLSLMGFGIAIELVQLLIPERSSTFADVLANFSGIVAFQFLFSIYLFVKMKKSRK